MVSGSDPGLRPGRGLFISMLNYCFHDSDEDSYYVRYLYNDNDLDCISVTVRPSPVPGDPLVVFVEFSNDSYPFIDQADLAWRVCLVGGRGVV